MGITTVMMKTTIKPAFLMVEIAVDLMSTHNTAQNANVLNEGKARIQFTITSSERNISIGYILSLAL
jgi:hypothetical protein